jgi:alpha-tubulin suppressor-like RCC1 family protein
LVTSSGHVECWGYNKDGELGDGTTTSSDIPVQVQGLSNAVEVAAGEGDDSCAALSTGRVDCWGDKSNGELGDGSREGKSEMPIEVHGITNAIQIANGLQYACALLSSGHVDCWGDEVLGNISSERRTPVEVPGIEQATQIAAGGSHACAVLSSGRVECWGENDYGELGNASTRASSSAVAVQSITSAIQVAAGGDHSCALLASGHVSCWGDNSAGDLGDGSKQQSDVPVEVAGFTDATQVTAGRADSCAVISGRVGCWGANYWGQLGDGTTQDSSTAVEVRGVRSATAVSAGAQHTCALLSGSYVECWGDNESDELGDGADGGNRTSPGAVYGLAHVTQASVGYPHSCALSSSGHVACWGDNQWGQLGDGSTERSQVPVEVAGVTTAVQVSSGPYNSCAVLSSGHIDCWGGNYFGAGQLGNGANESSTIPVEVAKLTNATQVATATFGSCARLSSGHVDCWGQNRDGELGDGSYGEPSDVPVEVVGISTAVEVAAGNYHFCALLSSGRVDCWGYNLLGQLGDGNQTTSNTPVEVRALTSAVRIAAANQHSCAVLSSGRVDCWGANSDGQLGVGGPYRPEACESPGGGFEGGFCSKTPVEAHGVTSAVDVATGASDACALLSSGHADCWGSNASGQLGNEACEYSNCLSYTPVEVQGLSGATEIAIGGDGSGNACAALSSGALECWGSNWRGALGNDLAWSTTPLGVVGFSPAVATGGASEVGERGATLTGSIHSEGGGSGCAFEYGPSVSYGISVACSRGSALGGGEVAVSAQITGLTPGTLYHYRLHTLGGDGSDATFKTLREPTTASGGASSSGAASEQSSGGGAALTSAPPSYGAPLLEHGIAKGTSASGAASAPRAAMLSSSASATRRGRLSLLMSCGHGAGPCTGTVAIWLLQRPKHHRGKARVQLASARYALAAATSARITLNLSSYARSLLLAGDVLHASATVTTRGAPTAATQSNSLTIHAVHR